MATARLQRELAEMTRAPPAYCSAGPIAGNLFKWQGSIVGPTDSPYRGGLFKLAINFPADYPNRPPSVVFATKVFHPNITEQDGIICLDILKNKWRPDISLSTLLLSICNLLTNPNPDDPMSREKADMYRDRRADYNKKAQEYTRMYADPSLQN